MTQLSFRTLIPATGMALAAMLLPLAAGAQGLEEVVVTAERREASLQSVPVAVTALSVEALQNRQVSEPQDLMRIVPSLKMNNNITSPTNLSPALRGSLQQDASLVVAESPFGIYVDDVFVPRLNGNNVSLADIERIEVLRGPQGTLYGRNTLAGAIKFITRTPGEDRWLNATVGAGNDDQARVGFSAGGPLGDNGWGGSLSAQYKTKDGQYFNVATNSELGEQSNTAARGKLVYSGERLDAVFSLSLSDSSGDSLHLPNGTTPNVPGNMQFTSDDILLTNGEYTVNTPNYATPPAPHATQPAHDTEQTIASFKLSWDLGNDLTLTSVTGFVGLEDFFSTDFNGNGSGLSAGSEISSDALSQEFKLQGTAMDERLDFLFGLYYFDESADQTFGWGLANTFALSTSLISIDTESIAVFAQANYRLTDSLTATFGARWMEDDKTFGLDFATIPGFFPPAPAERVDLANKYSEVTPKFALDWTLDPGGNVDSMLLFASVAKGFKSGGYSAIVIFPPVDIARTPYFPETNWTYEIGIKTDLFGNKFRINANYYYSDISDLTLNATTEVNGNLTFPVLNAGDVVIQGLEFEATWVPTDNLSLFLSGATADGEFKRLNPSAAPALALRDFGVQAQTPQTPDLTLSLGFDYSAETAFGDWGFGADYYWTDDYITSATNDFVVKAYNRSNAYAKVGFKENWEVRASVKNISDDATVSSGSRGLGGFVYLPPREIMLSVNYSM
jgi:iron complex outermembrane receptor protein